MNLLTNLTHSDPPIKNTIVGLSPDSASGLNKDGTCDVIFAVPPSHNAEVLGFRLVPSVSPLDVTRKITPALLLLTQKVDSYTPGENIERNLKMLKCPDGSISGWDMEIGSLPEPTKSTVVLPGLEDLTCIAAAVPSLNKNSFVHALYSTSEFSDRSNRVYDAATESLDEDASESATSSSSNSSPSKTQAASAAGGKQGRRVSTSDFFTSDSLTAPEFEIVLATGSDSACEIVRAHPHNSVALGHEDGNLILWAVSRPAEGGAAIGRGNLWFPLRVFKFGSVEVSAIYLDDQSPVFAAGNIAGAVAVFETYDPSSGLHYSDNFKQLLRQSKSTPLVAESTSLKGLMDEPVEEEVPAAKFVPNAWRQSNQFEIGEEVTAISFYAEICYLAIGASSGNVYLVALGEYTTEYNEMKPVLANVSALPRRGDVTKILNGTYFNTVTSQVVPAFYLFYSSGGIGVLNPLDGELFCFSLALTDSKSFNIAPDEDDEPDDHIDCRNSEGFSGIVIDSRNALCPPLTMQKYLDSRVPKKPETPEAAPVEKKSFWDVVRTADLGKSSKDSLQYAEGTPRYLLLSKGRHLIQLDINKFCNPSSSTSSSRGRKSVSVDVDNSIVFQKVISRTQITCSQVLNWTEEATRAYTKPLPSLSLVNCDGTVILSSIRDKSIWGHADLIDGILTRPVKFEQGVLLPNGDCFMVRNKAIVYSATVKSNTHIINGIASPVEGKSDVIPAVLRDQLLSGREKQIAASKTALQKRRTSIFTITSGPTDLDLIFQKTREPRRKKSSQSGIGGSASAEDDDEDELSSTSKQANNKLAQTMNVMNDTKLAFLERGEKLKQMQIRGEKMQSNAEEYKRGARQYKERLKAQSDRWGFF